MFFLSRGLIGCQTAVSEKRDQQDGPFAFNTLRGALGASQKEEKVFNKNVENYVEKASPRIVTARTVKT